jgi:hypothetical protein
MDKVLKNVCANHTISEEAADELYKKVEFGRNEDAILVLLLVSLRSAKRMDFSFGEAHNYSSFGKALSLVTAHF